MELPLSNYGINRKLQDLQRKAKIDGSLTKSTQQNGVTIRPGDIFKVNLSKTNGYFQFLYKDNGYMAGHLIRAFSYQTEKDVSVDTKSLLTSKIKFYTYSRIFEGISLGLWTKIGSEAIEKNFRPPLFVKLEEGEDLQAKKSMRWIVWSGDINNFVKIGERTAEFQHIDVASIFPPQAIVDWFEFGWHGFKLPE